MLLCLTPSTQHIKKLGRIVVLAYINFQADSSAGLVDLEPIYKRFLIVMTVIRTSHNAITCKQAQGFSSGLSLIGIMRSSYVAAQCNDSLLFQFGSDPLLTLLFSQIPNSVSTLLMIKHHYG